MASMNPLDIIYNNMQSIFPWNSNNKTTTINIAGNQDIEDLVIAQVASYGAQLGWLSDIVLALAKKEGVKTKEVEQLITAVEKINKIKQAVNASAKERAISALAALKRDNPDEYGRVIQAHAADLDNGHASHAKKSRTK